MRLWHKDLIPVLPRQQLLGQWRECCAIAKRMHFNGTPGHILVNRVADFPIEHFIAYTTLVKDEMKNRGYKYDTKRITDWIHWDAFFIRRSDIFNDWHNDRYLKQCYYNLQEKYDCGGISKEEWEKIENSVCIPSHTYKI